MKEVTQKPQSHIWLLHVLALDPATRRTEQNNGAEQNSMHAQMKKSVWHALACARSRGGSICRRAVTRMRSVQVKTRLATAWVDMLFMVMMMSTLVSHRENGVVVTANALRATDVTSLGDVDVDVSTRSSDDDTRVVAPLASSPSSRVQFDVVVFGATSVGVAAAVAAKRTSPALRYGTFFEHHHHVLQPTNAANQLSSNDTTHHNEPTLHSNTIDMFVT